MDVGCGFGSTVILGALLEHVIRLAVIDSELALLSSSGLAAKGGWGPLAIYLIRSNRHHRWQHQIRLKGATLSLRMHDGVTRSYSGPEVRFEEIAKYWYSTAAFMVASLPVSPEKCAHSTGWSMDHFRC